MNSLLAWVALGAASLLEIAWVLGIKYTAEWTKPVPSTMVIAAYNACLFLLAYAMRSLPVGLSYAVWVGAGMFGVTLLGVVLLGEPPDALRLFFTALIVTGVVGLKLTHA